MTNKEILEKLETTTDSDNAKLVKELLPQWDTTEEFPREEADMLRYIKMHQWAYADFGFGMENALKKVFPKSIIRTFFDVKEFRSNYRNVLASSVITLSKIKGLPMETQDDKAYCQYIYSLSRYYGHDD